MADEASEEPLFRSRKRRKALQKPSASGDLDDALPMPEAVITKHLSEEEDTEDTGVFRVQKKGGTRKHGIGFTSNPVLRSKGAENEALALAVLNEDAAQEVMSANRFVRPTGKVAVTENKHMVAYIDSKMAEMRSSAASPLSDGTAQKNIDGLSNQLDGEAQNITLPTPTASNASDRKSYQQAQHRSTRTYQRPSKRRLPRERDQRDVARDSMIEQIMHESQVPLYDRSHSQTPLADGVEIDNDAATAEAFKAQLLAEIEGQHRRRPPPSASASKGATIATGPKLGGSRSQREKMKALEEAKTGGVKK